MKIDVFNKVVKEQLLVCEHLLTGKGHEYAPDAVDESTIDRLAHFKKAAAIIDGTPKEALLGMLTKHLVSISDMCTDGRSYSLDRWTEKITDSINYLYCSSLVEEEANGMDKIKVAVLNPTAISEAEKMMVCAARLTQRGHTVKDLSDFLALYDKEYTEKTAKAMTQLPHPTIQKFAVINAVIVGASRRFLAQITRHQNEVKFMSASLQYSDYSNEADFVVPYELLDSQMRFSYLSQCQDAMRKYKLLIEYGVDNDSAGYLAPQGLRNVLIISATPYQWKHMISQRTCRRNTAETRYVMLRLWEELYELAPALFSPETTGPFCMKVSALKARWPVALRWRPTLRRTIFSSVIFRSVWRCENE